ncbi:MAG TPA: hypothetical protein VEG64_12650 [Candidatus Sulfotelmatobacter sp.]|nr:hypothetical protein [Candidatus Sulfotelmatobacter sp.]
MSKRTTKFTLVIAGLAAASLWPASVCAQAETAPDTYHPSGAPPSASAPAVQTHFEGSFKLSQPAQCAGHKLDPGEYKLIVKTVGEGKMVTLQREGHDIVLTVRRTAQSGETGKSAVLVRHGPGPGSRTLEAVYCEVLNMMLYLDESGHEKRMDKMFAGLKRVPVVSQN